MGQKGSGMNLRGSLFVLAATVVSVSLAPAQSIISARSGAIHHVEGKVLLDGKEVVLEFAQFPNVAEGSVLETERGRAEMLLTPGVILRLAENSGVKMIRNRLTDTRLEMTRGSGLVEVMEILKDNAITFYVNGASIGLEKAGLYRLDSDPAQLRVYKGKARVVRDDTEIVAGKGKLVELGSFLVAAKFDSKQDDALYRWSSRRSGYLERANLSAARSLERYGYQSGRSLWRWNPYFGMFTYVPYRGSYMSPFGWSFYSPSRVVYVYAPPRRAFASSGGGGGRGGWYDSSRGYTVVPTRGRSTAVVSSGSGSSGGGAAVSSSSGGTASRGGGGSVGRGSAGGGRGH